MFLENIYNQLKIKWFQEKDIFSSEEEKFSIDYENIYYEVEDLLSFDRAMRFCYASLEMMIHNRTSRQQCQNFLQKSMSFEEDLKKIATDCLSIDIKHEKRELPYTLPLDNLTIESILCLGLAVAGYRLSVYAELRNQVSMKNRILLNRVIAHVAEEIKFLTREKEIISVENILYSLN